MEVAVNEFILNETRGGGWFGYAVIYPAVGSTLTSTQMFTISLSQGFLPGTSVLLKVRTSGTTIMKRIWPSVITRVETNDIKVDQTGTPFCKIYFNDPLSYLGNSPIWGVYKDQSLEQMLGGVLSLAYGGDGNPTTNLTFNDLPILRIASRNLHKNIDTIPYAIAAGETLKDWLGAVFGRLGVRIEVKGNVDESVHLTLRDSAPSVAEGVTAHSMVLTDSDIRGGENRFNLASLTARPIMEQRGAIVDNPTRGSVKRIGGAGPVGMTFYGENITIDEAQRRNKFSLERDIISAVTINGTSSKIDLYPGCLVTFGQDILEESDWQVVNVRHNYGQTYTNTVILNRKRWLGDLRFHLFGGR